MLNEIKIKGKGPRATLRIAELPAQEVRGGSLTY